MSLDQQKEMAQYDRVAELQPAGTSGGKLLQREREKAVGQQTSSIMTSG
jgi:hypothetical protein